MTTTIGVEEEFVLLDPRTLMAVDRGTDAIVALSRAIPGVVAPEFFRSQIEHATPICPTVDDLAIAVCGFRRELAAWADDAGLIAAATGSPYRVGDGARLSDDDRYRRIGEDVGLLAVDHQFNGLHVHVGIEDRERAVRASNRLRLWLPTILAMSGDSPFWHAQDTGYESWRSIHNHRWTTHGVPPRFLDAADHDATVDALIGIGATSDPNTLNWAVRLSHRYPTVEVRVCDSQLDAASTVALAVVIRALAVSEDTIQDCAVPDAVWSAGLWHAARFGLSRGIVDPRDGRLRSASAVFRYLAITIAPELASAEHDRVQDFLGRLCADGTGAARQRFALRTGPAGLAALYRGELTA